MRPERIVSADPTTLAERAASWLVDLVAEMASSRAEPVRLALSGGSTPRALYERLAADPHRTKMPWDRLAIFWGDERGVPPDHAASNYRMAREAMIDRVPIADDRVHRIEGERDDADRRYEEQLRAQTDAGASPLDVVLLGMGSDGHCASLFPDTPELDTERWVIETWSPAPPSRRISLTLAAINRAPVVMVMVTGTKKSRRLAEVWSELDNDEPSLPLAMVRPAGRLVWMIDESAAEELPRP